MHTNKAYAGLFLACLFTFTLLLSGCEHEMTQLSCTESVLAANDMVPYSGQDLGCSFFLAEYQYEGQSYFMLGNHCADVTTPPFDCANNPLCENDPANCPDRPSPTFVGIIGIRP